MEYLNELAKGIVFGWVVGLAAIFALVMFSLWVVA